MDRIRNMILIILIMIIVKQRTLVWERVQEKKESDGFLFEENISRIWLIIL